MKTKTLVSGVNVEEINTSSAGAGRRSVVAQGTFKNINPEILLLHRSRRSRHRRDWRGRSGADSASRAGSGGLRELPAVLPASSRSRSPAPPSPRTPSPHPAGELPPGAAPDLPLEPRTSRGNGRAPAPPRRAARPRPPPPHRPSPAHTGLGPLLLFPPSRSDASSPRSG